MSYCVTHTPYSHAVESDFFQVTTASLDEAFAALEQRDVVFANNVSPKTAFLLIEEHGKSVLVARTSSFGTIRIVQLSDNFDD